MTAGPLVDGYADEVAVLIRDNKKD